MRIKWHEFVQSEGQVINHIHRVEIVKYIWPDPGNIELVGIGDLTIPGTKCCIMICTRCGYYLYDGKKWTTVIPYGDETWLIIGAEYESLTCIDKQVIDDWLATYWADGNE